MEHVALSDLENHTITADITKRLTDPLSLENMALNYYELAPGEGFSAGMHTHLQQEEIFLILEGTATFETPEEEIEVGAEEAIRFAPGEYQQGRNESDARVRALAFGAPRDQGEIRTPLACRECDAEYHTVEPGLDEMTLTCPECDNTFSVQTS